MCLLTETRALSAQGEKRALVGNLTMPDTLIRTPSYFIDKRSVCDYHKVHTPNFREKQAGT